MSNKNQRFSKLGIDVDPLGDRYLMHRIVNTPGLPAHASELLKIADDIPGAVPKSAKQLWQVDLAQRGWLRDSSGDRKGLDGHVL